MAVPGGRRYRGPYRKFPTLSAVQGLASEISHKSRDPRIRIVEYHKRYIDSVYSKRLYYLFVCTYAPMYDVCAYVM